MTVDPLATGIRLAVGTLPAPQEQSHGGAVLMPLPFVSSGMASASLDAPTLPPVPAGAGWPFVQTSTGGGGALTPTPGISVAVASAFMVTPPVTAGFGAAEIT